MLRLSGRVLLAAFHRRAAIPSKPARQALDEVVDDAGARLLRGAGHPAMMPGVHGVIPISCSNGIFDLKDVVEFFLTGTGLCLIGSAHAVKRVPSLPADTIQSPAAESLEPPRPFTQTVSNPFIISDYRITRPNSEVGA